MKHRKHHPPYVIRIYWTLVLSLFVACLVAMTICAWTYRVAHTLGSKPVGQAATEEMVSPVSMAHLTNEQTSSTLAGSTNLSSGVESRHATNDKANGDRSSKMGIEVGCARPTQQDETGPRVSNEGALQEIGHSSGAPTVTHASSVPSRSSARPAQFNFGHGLAGYAEEYGYQTRNRP